MTILFDTNVLCRLADRRHPVHEHAHSALRTLLQRRDPIVLVPQVLYEFWVACTRPANQNGLGLTARQAHEKQRRAQSLATLMHDTPLVFEEWQRLVVEHDAKGKSAHDARLVAAMKVHGIEAILTFNVADFARYPAIIVLDPAKVAATS